MIKRSRIVWKLSVVLLAIIVLVIVTSGYISNLICSHYSLESAKTVLNFNSRTLRGGIRKLMMSRNISGIKELIAEMSEDGTVYRDVRLVSHPKGEIIVSRRDNSLGCLDEEDESCFHCHGEDHSLSTTVAAFEHLYKESDGSRLLTVVTPITAEEGCMTSSCHSGTAQGALLGFLEADYSMGVVDAFISEWNSRIILVVVTAIVLSMAAIWFMLDRLVEKPISHLTEGIRNFAANNLDFRFAVKRKDEIGLLQESFNHMASRIEAHQIELKNAMEYLESIVENSADLIITVNPQGLIQTFNRGAELILGYRRREVIGKRIEMIFLRPQERDAAIRRLEHSDNVRNYETRFLAKNGETITVLLTLSRLRDPHGTPIGTLGISKDITRETMLQKQLMQSEKLAAIGQAVTGIQHAIKNMLNALKGGVYLVRSGTAKSKPERVDEGWLMVDEGISRITNLSTNMLNFAKEWKLEPERIELAALLQKVHEAFKESARQKGVILRTEFTGPELTISCDPRLIHMAVTDIVANALDACTWKEFGKGERPEVMLRTYSQSEFESVVIEVRDNGIGMTEEVKKNIFTPFFSTKKHWGTGLGLALTSRIIQLHGGKIGLDSEPGQGTVFRIILPAPEAHTNKETDDDQESSHHR